MAVAWSCSWIGLGAVQSSLVLFTGYRFGWGPQVNGFVLAGIGVSQAVVEGLLLRHIVARLGQYRSALLGYTAAALGYVALALAFAGWAVAPAVVLIALGGLAIPSLRSMVSERGAADSQGEMQGVLSAVEGLTAIVAPLLTAGLFFMFTQKGFPVHFAGAPFVVAGGAAALAGLLLKTL